MIDTTHYREATNLEPLHETASIGAGHMATALSQVFQQPVTVKSVDLHLVELEAVLEKVMERHAPVIATVVKIAGDLSALHVCIAPSSLQQIVPSIVQSKPSITQSFWLELGNILSGSALTALSRFLHLDFTQSVPDIAQGSWGAVADALLAQFGHSASPVLLWSATFTFSQVPSSNTFTSVFFCTPESTHTILASLATMTPSHAT